MTAFEGIDYIPIILSNSRTANTSSLFLEFGILPEIGKAVDEEGWT